MSTNTSEARKERTKENGNGMAARKEVHQSAVRIKRKGILA